MENGWIMKQLKQTTHINWIASKQVNPSSNIAQFEPDFLFISEVF